MALPLANPLYNVGPGGGIVTSLLGRNALEKSNLENQFYPINSMAQAASQLAYSNLMGPQFLAKLATNPDFLANVDKKTQEKVMPYLYNAAMSQGAGNSILNMPHQSPSGLGGFLVDKLMNVFGKKEMPQQMNQQNMLQQAPIQVGGGQQMVSPQVANAFQNMQPGEAIQIPENQNAIVNPIPSQKSVPEKTGEFLGIRKEGEKSGEIRAQEIQKLDDEIENSQKTLDNLHQVNNLLNSPVFERMHNLPLAQQHELNWYAKFGTKEEKDAVGQWKTYTGNIIKNASAEFKGPFRDREQSLLNGMKANDSDTIDTAKGKSAALNYLAEMSKQRAQITANIMRQQHISKGEAIQLADNQINGEKIRQKIFDDLHPTITIRNKKTNEELTLTPAEARKKGYITHV